VIRRRQETERTACRHEELDHLKCMLEVGNESYHDVKVTLTHNKLLSYLDRSEQTFTFARNTL
jgi:hypothetical protein